jgi:hypothetical protein
MSRKTLFFLSSDNFHAHILDKGILSAPHYFAHNAEGQKQFSAFLEQHRHPAYVLVDLIEEDFRHEVVPHLTGSNRQALIQRKFDQYYRNTQFRLARQQRRQSDGRRDDEMLFSALTNPGRITAWLDLLLLHKTPIVGIYSLPHSSNPIVRDIEYDNLLLLSWEKDAGLRQSYYFNQRLRFSRLTPLKPGTNFADEVANESNRTYQYLQSLSLTPHGDLLKVHIICHADDRPQLDARLASIHNMQFSYLDLQQLGKRFKSQHAFKDSDATPLFLQVLATQPPHGNYATPEHTHYYQLWQTQRGLFGLAAATALTCLAWATFSYMDGSGMTEEIDSLNSQANRMQLETQQIIRQFPSSPQGEGSTVTASDMKTAVTMFRNLQNYSVPPQQILKGLTDTLNNFPRIHTAKLSWQTGAAAGNFPEQVITFNGELADFGSDYRGAINYLERFQLVLTRAGYTVTPLKMPLDFSSQGSISAEISEGRDQHTDFSLKIIWRPQA